MKIMTWNIQNGGVIYSVMDKDKSLKPQTETE